MATSSPFAETKVRWIPHPPLFGVDVSETVGSDEEMLRLAGTLVLRVVTGC